MHPNAEHVAAALRRLQAVGTVRELDASARTAAEAATALGCSVGAIANSLVFAADGEPILILTSGAHRVDVSFVARLLGLETLERASPEVVRRVTGQPIGGVAPVGHPAVLATYVDRALRAYEVVWAAAGTPHTVFPTTAGELLRITEGREIPIEPGTAAEGEPE